MHNAFVVVGNTIGEIHVAAVSDAPKILVGVGFDILHSQSDELISILTWHWMNHTEGVAKLVNDSRNLNFKW